MKIRLTVWIMTIAGLTILLFQNREFYMGEQALSMNLALARIDLPPLAIATQVLLFFTAGLTLASLSSYHERFQLRRRIRHLENAFQSCAREVTELKAVERVPAKTRRFRLPEVVRNKFAKSKEKALVRIVEPSALKN